MGKISGFRLGIYVFKDVEVVDFTAPHGVFSVARRFDPELDAFLIADSRRPVQAQAGFTVLPNYSFADAPAMDALPIPGGFGTRQEMHNRRLHEYIRSLPASCLLTSVCTGSWIYGRMGLLDGLPATNRKEPDRMESSHLGRVPIDRLAEIAPACLVSRARVVDAGRIITAGGISSGMELGFHLLRRAGYEESFIAEVARTMEYHRAYQIYCNDIEYADPAASRALVRLKRITKENDNVTARSLRSRPPTHRRLLLRRAPGPGGARCRCGGGRHRGYRPARARGRGDAGALSGG